MFKKNTISTPKNDDKINKNFDRNTEEKQSLDTTNQALKPNTPHVAH